MKLRLARREDADTIRDIYAPFIETPVSFELVAPDADTMWSRISETMTRTPWLVLDDDGVVAGYAYAGPHRSRAGYQWSVEASVYVAPTHRRRGVARRLYAALFEVLAWQGFVNVYAGIALPNEASVAFHRSMGFEAIGVYEKVGFKNGAWIDVSWWVRTLGARPEVPATPRLLPEVREDPQLAILLSR